jgi:phage FluMu protein Com
MKLSTTLLETLLKNKENKPAVQYQIAKRNGTITPRRENATMQIPSEFIRLLRLLEHQQRRQVASVTKCPRCKRLVVTENAPICAGCGLPLFGCECPSCRAVIEYYPEHVRRDFSYEYNRHFDTFFCPHCGTKLMWRQIDGGPAYLEFLRKE